MLPTIQQNAAQLERLLRRSLPGFAEGALVAIIRYRSTKFDRNQCQDNMRA
jgi:hypothetical protein